MGVTVAVGSSVGIAVGAESGVSVGNLLAGGTGVSVVSAITTFGVTMAVAVGVAEGTVSTVGCASEQAAIEISTASKTAILIRCIWNPLAARVGYLSQSPGPIQGRARGHEANPLETHVCNSDSTLDCDNPYHSLAKEVRQADRCSRGITLYIDKPQIS